MSRNLLETSPNAVLALVYLGFGLRYFGSPSSRISAFFAQAYGWNEGAIITLMTIGFLSMAMLVFLRSPAERHIVFYALPYLAYNLFTVITLMLSNVPIPAGGDIVTISSTFFFFLYDWQYQHRQSCEVKCNALATEVEALKAENTRLKAETEHAKPAE